MAKTKSGAKDARFRHREPVVWHGTRAETLRHVRDGDRFVRPDLCVWIEGYTVRAERRVPPEAPNAIVADLLEEALARLDPARGRPPAELVVPDDALAEILRARFGDRFAVHVRARGAADDYARRMLDAQGSDLDDPPRTILDRAAVTAEDVSAFHREFARLFTHDAWRSLSPWSLRFVLRAPELGWPDARLRLHGAAPDLSVARAGHAPRADDGERRGWRPSETFGVDARFIPQGLRHPARVAEIDAHGWRAQHDPEAILGLNAYDVDHVPRPIAPGDLAIATTAARALHAWLTSYGPGAPAGTTVAVEGGEIVFRGRAIDPLAPADVAVAAWCDAALPVDGPLDASSTDIDRARARLKAAPSSERAAATRALAAEGAATVSALLALLDDGALWQPPPEEPWLVPWVLAALAWSGDPRVPTRMLRALVARVEDLGDFLTESVPAVLAALGPGAIEPLAAVLQGTPCDAFLRDDAGCALYLIGAAHPDARVRIAEIFAEFYESLLDNDDGDAPMLASGIAAEAARMHDPRVDAAVRAVHDAGIWDRFVFRIDDYDRERSRPPWSIGFPIDEVPLDEVMANPWWERAQ